MSGDPLLVDTNILIHHWNGDPRTTRLLDNELIHISFISEIGVLGFHGYTAH
jgi:predicted nucleic acid-binding protein